MMEHLFIQRAYNFVKTELAPLYGPSMTLGTHWQRHPRVSTRFEVPKGANTDHVTAAFAWHNKKYDGHLPLHHAHIMRLLVM